MQSFLKMNECIDSNSLGLAFNFCLRNKIKLIYSTASASLGNKVMTKTYLLMLFQNQKI